MIIDAIEKLLSLLLINDFSLGNNLNLNFINIVNTDINLNISIRSLAIITIGIVVIISLYYLCDIFIIFYKKYFK